MGVRISDLVAPLAPYLPYIEAPKVKVPFQQRFLWTTVVLLIFLLMREIPLYGVVSSDTSDQMMWLRTMLASNRGTLMELGITPLMSSSMVFQLLISTGLLEVNNADRRERELMASAQKLLALILSGGQATVYVLTGMYGVPSSLGAGVCLFLVLQLVMASLIVILLDEMLQKGYGLGSGTTLFVTTNTCEQVVWSCMSPNTVSGPKGVEMEGAVVAFFQLLATRKSKKKALIEAFTRKNLPNLTQVGVTALLFLVVVYAQRLRVDLPLRNAKIHANTVQYPIKLFYTANMPIMLYSALTQNVVMISQMLFSQYPDSPFTKLLGVWEASRTGSLQAVSGACYYLMPPTGWREIVTNPLRSIIYDTVVIGTCAAFSKLWLEVSNTGPKDVARQFHENGLSIIGARESTYRELKKLIPTAAVLGGAAIGVLSVTSDMLGALGSGTSILLAVTTIYGYVETATAERM